MTAAPMRARRWCGHWRTTASSGRTGLKTGEGQVCRAEKLWPALGEISLPISAMMICGSRGTCPVWSHASRNMTPISRFSLGMLIGQNGVLGSFSLPEQVARSLSIVSPSNWLHRKELLSTIGGWSPSLRYACDIDFLARLQAAAMSTVFHRRLSVLKYPAAEWRAYDQQAEPRQTRDLAAMKKDAEGLAGELLLDLAALVSRQKTYRSRSRVPLFIRVALARMVEIWGPHRWPLSAILRRRHRNRAGLGA